MLVLAADVAHLTPGGRRAPRASSGRPEPGLKRYHRLVTSRGLDSLALGDLVRGTDGGRSRQGPRTGWSSVKLSRLDHEGEEQDWHRDDDEQRDDVDALLLRPRAPRCRAVAHELLGCERGEREDEAARPCHHADGNHRVDRREKPVPPRR